jgi:hypothetical protein
MHTKSLKTPIFGTKSLETSLLLLVCAMLLCSCGTIKFQYYDETTDKGLTSLHADINSFLTSYKANKSLDYNLPIDKFLDQVSALQLRARSRKSNEIQVAQLSVLKDSVIGLKTMFPLNSDETTELLRNLIESAIEPILQAELSKVRK